MMCPAVPFLEHMNGKKELTNISVKEIPLIDNHVNILLMRFREESFLTG
jgi:hypothetical protein